MHNDGDLAGGRVYYAAVGLEPCRGHWADWRTHSESSGPGNTLRVCDGFCSAIAGFYSIVVTLGALIIEKLVQRLIMPQSINTRFNFIIPILR